MSGSIAAKNKAIFLKRSKGGELKEWLRERSTEVVL
jgi:hypothetical protein